MPQIIQAEAYDAKCPQLPAGQPAVVDSASTVPTILQARLSQALKSSAPPERLLDLSRVGINPQWSTSIVRNIASHFLIDDTPDNSGQKIAGLSFSHNPNLGSQGSASLLLSVQRLIFEAPRRHCLQALDLYNIGLTDQCVPGLLDCIERGAPTLCKIKIGDNAISAAGMWHMLQRSSALASVQQLHLGGNPLLDQGIKHLSWLLTRLPEITNIGIRDVKCSDSGLGLLFDALALRHARFPAWSSVTEIQLRGNQIRLPQTMTKLATCFEGGAFAQLSVLDLSGCRAPDEGMAILYTALLRSNNIVTLREADMAGNALGPLASAELRGLLLSEPCTIVSLNLSSSTNSSSTHFGTAIGGLERNSSVSNLCLAGNDLKGPGGEAIAAALLTPTCAILALDISGCSIGPDGMTRIFNALAQNTARTKVLEAANNNAGLQSVPALVEMLSANIHLSKLHIQDNAIPLDGGMTRIADVIEGANFVLRQMSFGGQSSAANGLTSFVRQQVNQTLLRNKAVWEAAKAERVKLSRATDAAIGSWGPPPHATFFSSEWTTQKQPLMNKHRLVVLQSPWDLPTLF